MKTIDCTPAGVLANPGRVNAAMEALTSANAAAASELANLLDALERAGVTGRNPELREALRSARAVSNKILDTQEELLRSVANHPPRGGAR